MKAFYSLIVQALELWAEIYTNSHRIYEQD